MTPVGTMSFEQLSDAIKDAATVKRAFGDPIERDGVTIIPVAKIGGGGGAGGGGTETEGGNGGAFGAGATPLGVYVVRNGEVSWRPALDVNKIIAGAQLASVVLLLSARSILKRRAKKR